MAYDEFIAKLIHLEAGDECPIHVAAAILKPDKNGKVRVVSGRGETAEEAEQRSIAEAAERHAAVFDPDHAPIYASLDELGTTAADPRSILLISDRQYELAPIWNAEVEPDHRLPLKFDPQAKIGWVAAHSVKTGETIHVPAAYACLGYPNAMAEGFPVPDSNGLASGASLKDAIERAVLETIERDAVSIWWYGRTRRPEMVLDRAKLSFWAAYTAWMRRIDREFWILDLTHDLGIPVAAAISCDGGGSDLAFGFAAARTREEAASSALGEMVQFHITKRLQTAQGAAPPTGFLAWCGSARLERNAFLTPGALSAATECGGVSDRSKFIDLLPRAGLEPLLVDFPMPGLGIHVVRAVVPRLRAIWPRFAPGRLYDVPFSLGWHTRKMTEAELNPVPILY